MHTEIRTLSPSSFYPFSLFSCFCLIIYIANTIIMHSYMLFLFPHTCRYAKCCSPPKHRSIEVTLYPKWVLIEFLAFMVSLILMCIIVCCATCTQQLYIATDPLVMLLRLLIFVESVISVSVANQEFSSS